MATKSKKSVLKTFKVFRSWEMSGWDTVVAKTQEDAENSVDTDDSPLPDGDYVSGSCQVVREFTLEYNKKTNEWNNCQN